MAKTVWGPGLNKFTGRLRTANRDVREQGADIAERTAELGAALMRAYIETRGTGYKGHVGRIETRKMLEAVGVGTLRHTSSGVEINFGWGTNGVAGEKYYRLQEDGFINPFTGLPVPPMHALLDATVQSREFFYAEIRRRFK